MKRRFPIALLAAGLAGISWASAVQLEPAAEIMWRKLDLSHAVLDALALEDFEALEACADDLISLSYAGVWFVSDAEIYRERAERFRASARGLRVAARSRRSEAAALAYVELTLGCIRCHRELGGLPGR